MPCVVDTVGSLPCSATEGHRRSREQWESRGLTPAAEPAQTDAWLQVPMDDASAGGKLQSPACLLGSVDSSLQGKARVCLLKMWLTKG